MSANRAARDNPSFAQIAGDSIFKRIAMPVDPAEAMRLCTETRTGDMLLAADCLLNVSHSAAAMWDRIAGIASVTSTIHFRDPAWQTPSRLELVFGQGRFSATQLGTGTPEADKASKPAVQLYVYGIIRGDKAWANSHQTGKPVFATDTDNVFERMVRLRRWAEANRIG